MARTRLCDKVLRDGRMNKAEQFIQAADIALDGADDIDDAIVTLWVHAGIAASDVICCAGLGEFSQSDNHNEAITLLGSVDKESAKNLKILLGLKTRAGYTHLAIGRDDTKRAGRAARALMEAARRANAHAGG